MTDPQTTKSPDITYAIADLHGRYDLLDAALTRITQRGGGKVVLMGDYVDRGPQSRQIIDRLMAGPPEGQQWICLKGNHEDIMLQACSNPAKLTWWLPNGGGATLISYGQSEGDRADVSVVPAEHLRWMAALPLMHIDGHRVFVHAGVDADRPLYAQDETQVIWMRFDRSHPWGHGDLHMVHGHEQYVDGPVLHPGRTDLDTLAWATGRLVVGVFDNQQAGGPVELLEIRGAPDSRFAGEVAA